MPSKRPQGTVRWAIDIAESASSAWRATAIEVGERGGGRVLLARVAELLAARPAELRSLVGLGSPAGCDPAASPSPSRPDPVRAFERLAAAADPLSVVVAAWGAAGAEPIGVRSSVALAALESAGVADPAATLWELARQKRVTLGKRNDEGAIPDAERPRVMRHPATGGLLYWVRPAAPVELARLAPVEPAPPAPVEPAPPVETAPPAGPAARIAAARAQRPEFAGIDEGELVALLLPLQEGSQNARHLDVTHRRRGGSSYAGELADAAGLVELEPLGGEVRLAADARAWLSGVVTTIYDSEGRAHRVYRRRVPLRELAVSPDPGEFQSRSLRSGPERAKIERMAERWEPARAARTDTGTPTEGAPVVWRDDDGRPWVVAGNGRVLAARRAVELGREVLDPMPVRELIGTRREARELAAASQESTAGAQSDLGRARALAAAVGLGPGDGPRWVPAGGINAETIGALIEKPENAAFVSALRPTGIAERDAERARLLVAGSLPAEVLAVAELLGARAETAIAGAAPRIAALCAAAERGLVRSEYCLRPLFARAAVVLGELGVHPDDTESRYSARLAAWSRTGDLVSGLPAAPLTRAEAAFVLALRRFAAGRHADPAAAFDEALARLHEHAMQPENRPGQGSLFGQEPIDVVRVAFGARIAEYADRVAG